MDPGGDSQRRTLALPTLCVAFLGLAVVIWVVSRHTEFFGDEWPWIYDRLGFNFDNLIRTHNGNLMLVPLLLYQAVIGLFGLDIYWPFRALTIAFTLLCSVLLFIYLRRRIGDWLAFFPAVFLPAFGAAFWIQTTSLGLVWTISISAGLGSLIALDRRDRRGDLMAAALLAVSIGSHSAGVAFAAAVAISVSLRPWPERWRRIWVWLLSVCLYLAWSVWVRHHYQGSAGASPAKLSNITSFPRVVVDSIAAVVMGIAGIDVDSHPVWVSALATTIALALIVWAVVLAFRRKFPRDTVIFVALALIYWLTVTLVAVGSDVRKPTDSRYLYLGAMAIALVAASLLPRPLPRISRRAWAVAGVLLVVSLALNIRLLSDKAPLLADSSKYTRAALTGIELSGKHGNPAFAPHSPVPLSRAAIYLPITAGDYLAQVQAHGSPALSQAELRRSNETSRLLADRMLAGSLGIQLVRSGHSSFSHTTGGACESDKANSELRVPPGSRVVLRTAGRVPVTVVADRFSSHPVVPLGTLAPREVAQLSLPRDRVKLPWTIAFRSGNVTVCETILEPA